MQKFTTGIVLMFSVIGVFFAAILPTLGFALLVAFMLTFLVPFVTEMASDLKMWQAQIVCLASSLYVVLALSRVSASAGKE